MKKIESYITKFKDVGFKVDRLNKTSALFSKGDLQFKARVKWRSGFEIFELNDYEKNKKEIERINLLVNLKNKDFIDEDTFTLMMNKLDDGSFSEVALLIYNDIKKEIILNLSSVNKLNINKFKYLLVIIPRSSRAEFIADLQCIISDMKADNCSKYYIAFIVSLHIISVAYHAFFFKLKGYFYSNKQNSNRN